MDPITLGIIALIGILVPMSRIGWRKVASYSGFFDIAVNTSLIISAVVIGGAVHYLAALVAGALFSLFLYLLKPLLRTFGGLEKAQIKTAPRTVFGRKQQVPYVSWRRVK